MPELNPPNYTQGGCVTAQSDRLIWSSLICDEGVAAPGDLAVSAGGGMSVDVAPGSAFVQGDTVADQGMYHVVNDSVVNLAIDPADPTDDRIDLVVAQVNDSQYVGAVDDWELEVITGSPSPAPSPPAVPDSALPLAEVLVQGGAVTIVAGDISDQAPLYAACTDRTNEMGPWLHTPNNGSGWNGSTPTNIGGAPDWGLRKQGDVVYIAIRVSPTVDRTFSSIGNISDILLGTISDSDYWPAFNVYVPGMIVASYTTWWRVQPDGQIWLSHGSAGGYTWTQDSNCDINSSWTVA